MGSQVTAKQGAGGGGGGGRSDYSKDDPEILAEAQVSVKGGAAGWDGYGWLWMAMAMASCIRTEQGQECDDERRALLSRGSSVERGYCATGIFNCCGGELKVQQDEGSQHGKVGLMWATREPIETEEWRMLYDVTGMGMAVLLYMAVYACQGRIA
ncbi:hypothetical protein AC578_8792 [Pseudocercospora eumusae]|uniref:Uncharacterized protein n=1 Tax=Pseudocercospora eumusae TaxID=321146 RepID=A0A139H6M9_9PEZI|nr:hypothetical protein AC578_8792 [Pseudocercospora eumusae]